MGKRPTLADVARHAGVSTAVVSYVVNDGPRQVSQKTRERVENSISILNYRRNALASTLMTGRSNLIGLLVPDTSNAFFGELAKELELCAKENGFLMLLGNTNHDPTTEEEYDQALTDLRARAVFISTASHKQLKFEGNERIYLNSAPDDCLHSNIKFDDYKGGKIAGEHLVSLGHKRIHCLAGSFDFGPFAQRRKGWQKAMRDAGLNCENQVHQISADRLEAVTQIAELLQSVDTIEAFFATSDEQALAAVRAAAQLGLSVPDDLAIVGMDGIKEARMGRIQLTTVSVPLKKLAQRALECMLNSDKEKQDIVLPVELLIGETCGAAAKKTI